MPGISQISPARPRSSPGVTRAPASEIRASDFRACEYGAACEDTKNSCPPALKGPAPDPSAMREKAAHGKFSEGEN
jgi:hypothetical protein